MAQPSHRPPLVAVVVCGSLLVAACGGQGGLREPSAFEGEAEGAAGAGADERCDLGFNTAAYNDRASLASSAAQHHAHAETAAEARVDFTVREWAEVFTDEQLGMSVAEVTAAVEADDIDRRHVLGGVLTHTLEADPWVPMTDRGDCDALAGQLGMARQAAARYPTVADALADGYIRADAYNAGLGAHFQKLELLGDLDAAQPAQLLFDGTDPDSTLVGLSYVVLSLGEPPEGFVGVNDRWHLHRTFCLDPDTAENLSSDVLSESECNAIGGAHVPNDEMWMLHVWVAPGCESDWGIFSGANPRLPYLPRDASFAIGCNSGKSLADGLDLDERGAGPSID